MTPRPARFPRLLILLGVLAALPPPAWAAAPDPALEPARIGWREIRLRGSKMFLSADAVVTFRVRPPAEVEFRTAPGVRNIEPAAEVVELVSTASGAGRRSVSTLTLDPASGAALQRVQHDSQGRLRYRVYRYAEEGAYQWTRWPLDKPEQRLPPAQWSKTSEGLRSYADTPGGSRPPGPVLEASGLLYAVPAAALDRPGDRAAFTIFSRHTLQRVVATVVDGKPVKVAYDQHWPSGTVRRASTVRPIRISLAPEVRGGDPEQDELELLGLRGDLLLSLDPESRAPLELTGDVKLLGRVTLRLASLTPR